VDVSDNNKPGRNPRLILNREYIVYGTQNCPRCGVQDLDVGLTVDLDSNGIIRCTCEYGYIDSRNIHWCGSFRFRKVAEKVEYIAVAVSVEIEKPILN
jgi:hypothetical protein